MKQQGVSGKLRDVSPEVDWKDANLTREDLSFGTDLDKWEYILPEEIEEPFTWR